MTPRFCEVALPIPIRSTFTYSIPENLLAADLLGSRVVVPFRNRAMVGVVVRLDVEPPAGKKTKVIAELLESIPALSPKLLELADWVSRYYVAPLGETLRAMLPPLSEHRQHRKYEITAKGNKLLEELSSRGPTAPGESSDLAVLDLLVGKRSAVNSARLRRIAGGEAAAERLARRGCLEAHDLMSPKRGRLQNILAWDSRAVAAGEDEERIRQILMATRGPLPFAALLSERVSRGIVTRLVKQGKLVSWEEPLTPEE